MRILIVDDNPTNRKLLRAQLETENFTVLEAADGLEALSVLERESIDTIISDILMPRMDGHRFCLEVRKNERLRSIPFIVYTSIFSSPADEKLALEMGADRYITKPAPANSILDAIREVRTRHGPPPVPQIESRHEVALMKEYSEQLVAKLEEKNIELEQRIRLAALSAEVATALMHGNTLRELLQRCSEALVQHLDAAFARIWTYNEPEKMLELQASAGRYTHINGPHSRVPIGKFKIGLIAEERKPHLTNSVIGDSRVLEQEWARRAGLVAFAGYPLMIGDRVVGVMAMFACHPLSQVTLDAMASIADGVAMGIERKRAETELARTHLALLETSRQAGMAEVATDVLHNVGNALNSVNVASICLADSLKKSKAANLSKVVALLREHEADLGTFLTTDAKGKQIPGYLSQLAEHLSGEQAAALKELAQLQKNVEHIKDIVSMQQNFASVSGVPESVNATDLVEAALRMNVSSITRHDIQILKEFEEVPPVMTQKYKVLQILVNLIRNASQACDESGHSENRLTLRVRRSSKGVSISVGDNGVGIPRENLTRIFAHGFTTKKDGHGFVLHGAALSAKELGGALSVRSDGVGRGATFTLELPVKPPE